MTLGKAQQKVNSQMFLKNNLQQLPLYFHLSCCQGYSFITQIPEGAWDIQIIERKKSTDVLGESLLSARLLFMS